jgi:hypothetical protein
MATYTHATAGERDKRARRRIQRDVMYKDIQELLEYRLLHQPQDEHAYCHHLARQEQRSIDRTQYRWQSVGIYCAGIPKSRPFTPAHLAHPKEVVEFPQVLAKEVDEATHGQFPPEIVELICDYAIMLRAGDWCVMQEPGMWHGEKIGVITHVVQRSLGIVTLVHVHECGRERPFERDGYTLAVRSQLDMFDKFQGPTTTLHAPRYQGQNPSRDCTIPSHCNVNVYTDTGRVPFNWLRPVILTMQYNANGSVADTALRIVASGNRFRMEAALLQEHKKGMAKFLFTARINAAKRKATTAPS